LVFPTAGCKPKLDFLDCLKTCAERAELGKEGFWLHKFRDVRHAMPVGWSGSADRSAMARSLRYGIDDAIFEAIAESAGA